jgi:hypothetical protein
MMEIMYMARWLADYKSSPTHNHLLDIFPEFWEGENVMLCIPSI